MKSILVSINPKWVAKILNGEKTIEIRKSKPKCDLPITVYIYCTKGNHIGYLSNRYVGKIVAEFVLRKIETIERGQDLNGEKYTIFDKSKEELAELLKKSCLSFDQFVAYCDKPKAFFWRIDNLKVYEKPKDLMYFGLLRAPQSWCKVSEMAIAFSEEFEKMERKMKKSSKKGSVKIKPIEWSVPTYTIKK